MLIPGSTIRRPYLRNSLQPIQARLKNVTGTKKSSSYSHLKADAWLGWKRLRVRD